MASFLNFPYIVFAFMQTSIYCEIVISNDLAHGVIRLNKVFDSLAPFNDM